ncbi:MAG: metallophosphoesterase [Desulfurococcaceae archaeon]
MIKLLVMGDTHIPDRASEIHPRMRNYIENERPWSIVIFTGDLTSEKILEWVESLGKQVIIVKGNIDYLPLPRSHVFRMEEFTIGVHHGDGIFPRGDTGRLSSLARSLKSNILITGHTHSDFIKTSPDKDILLLNPGSLTGVWGGGGGSYIPSFMVVEIGQGEISINTLKLINEDLRVTHRHIKYYERKWIL